MQAICCTIHLTEVDWAPHVDMGKRAEHIPWLSFRCPVSPLESSLLHSWCSVQCLSFCYQISHWSHLQKLCDQRVIQKDNLFLLPLSHHRWAAQHCSFLFPRAAALKDWWHLAMIQHYSLQRDVAGHSHLLLHKPSHTMAYLTSSLLLNALSETLHFYASYSAPDFGFSISQNASTFPSLPQSLVCLDRTSDDPIIVLCMCVHVSTYKHIHHHEFTGTGSVLEHGHRFHFHFSSSWQKPQIVSFYFQNKKISELRVISPFS